MFFFLLFSSLFCPVLQRPLFPTCRVLKPPPLHRTSPLKPRKSRRRHCLIRGHISKICFSSFFVSFLTSVAETSFPHMPGPQTPTSPPCLAPQASQVLLPPLPAFAGTQVKISFFFLFFHFFSDQCYRDPLYPTRWVLKPPPLHHIIPTPCLAP